MDSLLQDIRYAIRTLGWSPGFTLGVVFVLALGIGANTAVFSVVDGVLLRPLPYPDPDRLVRIEGIGYKGEYLEMRERSRTLAVAAFHPVELSLTGTGEPARLTGAAVSSELFAVLGVTPLLGRTFAPEEMRPGSGGVVVLGYGLWQERFGGDPGVVGRTIVLDGDPHTIIGVLPAGFAFPGPEARIWVPLRIDPADRIDLWSMGASIIGRLRPAATLDQARAEIRTLAPRMRELFPWDMPADYGARADVVRLRDAIVGETRPLLLALLGAVGMVLLVACANVANLLLVRAAGRRRETAVRSALGASTGRLVQQVLSESVLLSIAGAVAGAFLAALGVDLLTAWLPADTPRIGEIRVDGRVLGFALALGLGTGLLFGALPALRAARTDPADGLRAGTRVAGDRRWSTAGALVAAEVALAVVLVTGASLLTRSFFALLREDPGFVAESVATAEVAPPAFRYADDAACRGFYDALVERLSVLPGVRGVAVTNRLPFGDRVFGGVFVIEGRPDPATSGGDWPWADVQAVVSEDFLQTLGIPLVRGRAFTPADREGAEPVALISESLAREYWSDEDPIGKRIRFPGRPHWVTIVGIVADVKYGALSDPGGTALYLPMRQAAITGPMHVVVRTTGAPDAAAASLRAIVASLDPDAPVSDVATLDHLIGRSLARPRIATLLVGAFALLALTLGAVGIYGVLAYAVGRRTHEIGVRMALGARAADVTAMVVRRGVAIAGVGIAVGLLVALPTSRLIRGLLYGIAPTDAATFIAVPTVMLATALLASWIPAARAARVNPMVAMKGE